MDVLAIIGLLLAGFVLGKIETELSTARMERRAMSRAMGSSENVGPTAADTADRDRRARVIRDMLERSADRAA
jgi:hypothetical protein